MRESFERHIKGLNEHVVAMSEMVASATSRSIKALETRDVKEAEQIVKDDLLINKKRWQIEEECISLIALQQPVASDLREIIAVLNVITDLERMGDYAEGIAKIAIMLSGEPLIRPLIFTPQMTEKTIDMLRRSIQAFVKRDAKTAEAICNEDDEVDKLYDQSYHDLLMRMIKDPTVVSRATPLIWAAHNLERSADRVTNICERTVFLATGIMPQVNVSKY
ncbi:MAG: phosphate signaling complex protein PhoU [Phycisphaerae bacterium]|nr:phosphate signaling complex protein PhoU [Phycisphaerae bacterium]MDD5380705.1 phosphate signaling complex protein PhoU [Phycisphaerae bacterium]